MFIYESIMIDETKSVTGCDAAGSTPPTGLEIPKENLCKVSKCNNEGHNEYS